MCEESSVCLFVWVWPVKEFFTYSAYWTGQGSVWGTPEAHGSVPSPPGEAEQVGAVQGASIFLLFVVVPADQLLLPCYI